ncbi:MAG: lysylphosphatidylglycerol synthase transmembrane domain-containing protein [Bacteroidota bacterium]
MTEKQRKLLTTILKTIISLFLIYFIFTKIDFQEVVYVLKSANWVWLTAALLLYVISKVFNSLRLNLYFHAIDVPLTQMSNLKLYLLGMFYNLFLPGGIGGDAYKGYVIQKKFKAKIKRVVGVLLLDRLSGMLLILIYACVFAGIMQIPIFNKIGWFFWTAIPMGIFFFWIITKRLFPYAIPIFWSSFGYSALLQAIQLGATICIIRALGTTDTGLAYLFIFMISSLVSVIPLTIGGIGSREVTFLYGAKWLGLDANVAIGISFVFFLITALVSFFGIGYHFKKPKLETVTT